LLWLWIYILKGWLTPGSNAGRVNRLPLLQTVQSGSDVHPATYVFSTLSCFRGVQRPDLLTTQLRPVLLLRMSGAVPLFPLYAFVAFTGIVLLLLF